ncbi:hypothetical protein PGTUg99_017429 [Puccinia graminis f. sp. tritici]|uniref:Uncharacterized protein n=1 Tax=Puccinia graminis f. sp. tritici TaxID=56615 RepID=A0A5B0NWX2_PUCGR|nr:hypothetical protein PGTUg99_017429 [Puccinia graminis f. sp. tritici]
MMRQTHATNQLLLHKEDKQYRLIALYTRQVSHSHYSIKTQDSQSHIKINHQDLTRLTHKTSIRSHQAALSFSFKFTSVLLASQITPASYIAIKSSTYLR